MCMWIAFEDMNTGSQDDESGHSGKKRPKIPFGFYSRNELSVNGSVLPTLLFDCRCICFTANTNEKENRLGIVCSDFE